MHPASESLRHLAQQSRAHAPALLAAAEDPHAELLAMVWGPHFDRQHALDLWVRLSQQHPSKALPVLSALLSATEFFDALGVPVRHRVRRLILRHHAAATQRKHIFQPDRATSHHPSQKVVTRAVVNGQRLSE